MMAEAKDSDTSQPSDHVPELFIPGLHTLHEAVENYVHEELPSRAAIRREGISGLSVAVSGIPDGMAGGILAGVNPIYGLYANIIGPLVGGIFSSTQLMVINNTSAVSLVAGQSLIGVPSGDREGSLSLMVILAGVLAALFGLLRLGRMTRYVSYSVMTGFLAGIATVLILSQLSTVTGYESEGSNRIAQVIDLLRNTDKVSSASLVTASATLLLAFLLMHTRLRMAASLLAIAFPSAVAALALPGIVKPVSDLGRIPGGIPMPALPSLANLSLDVFTGALSLALVILVQGAGVSQSVPNPDGSRRSLSHDFTAQGAANIAVGFFRGLPVGGRALLFQA
jgi:SulP family sulfate permease